jgi:hypothetical protein
MTARLRYLNFEICFNTSFSSVPLSIKFNSKTINLKKGKTFLPLLVSVIDQKIDIEFSGYVPNDKDQKISIELYYEKVKLDTDVLCSFQMINNLYVDNNILKDYNEIYFNGVLTLHFFKKWFECNMLNGANLCKDTTLIHWQMSYTDTSINGYLDTKKTNADIFCIGDSFTFGEGVDRQHTWPAILTSKTNKDNINLGSGGLSVDGCLINVEYVLNNFEPKTIICLLPTRFRKIYKFNFLDYFGYITVGLFSDYKFPKIFKTGIETIKRVELLDDNTIKRNWIDSCKNIIKSCQCKNIKCFISTWDKDMYEHIPEDVRLPKFPDLEMFKERATDGLHPHKKHYELFVESIFPYIQ